MKQMLLKLLTVCLLAFCGITAGAQQHRYTFYPEPPKRPWNISLGVINTTFPHDITEEVRFRIPAGELMATRRLAGHFYLSGKLDFQVLQNLVTLGPRFALPLGKRFDIGLGNDIGLWFGRFNLSGIKTSGYGVQNYPNASLGINLKKHVRISLLAESIMNLTVQTRAGGNKVNSDYRLLSGGSYAVVIEQPFYGTHSLSLGFRAIYSDYYWQTWTLFEAFDRNLFYPQVIIALIL